MKRWTTSRAVRVAVLVVAMSMVAPVAAGATDEDWTQVGEDLTGEAPGDESGARLAMSADGKTIATTAIFAGGGTGQVRMFRQDGTDWNQLGSTISGLIAGGRFGDSMAISADGNTVVVGAIGGNAGGFRSGQVRVFRFDGTDWTQLGRNLDGQVPGDWFGASVAMSSDGETIAVGAPQTEGANYGAGQVQVFGYDGSDWVQVGLSVAGKNAEDRFGYSVAMSSDGATFIAGAILNDDNGRSSGHARVFHLDADGWRKIGGDLRGAGSNYFAGWSVAMDRDGTTVAVGSIVSTGARLPGQVRVFRRAGNGWRQVGRTIQGEGAGDYFGSSLAMNADGSTIVAGAPRNGDNGILSGQARVFRANGADWAQVGCDIEGRATRHPTPSPTGPVDFLGRSVAVDSEGSTIVVGGILNRARTAAGYTRVFTLAGAVEGDSGVVQDGQTVHLINRATDRYLDGDGSQRGWNVDTSTDAREDSRWRLVDNGDGTWLLLNRRRGRYLDGDNSSSGSNVGLSVRADEDDRWEIIRRPDGLFTLRNATHDQYLHESAGPNVDLIDVGHIDDAAACAIGDFGRWEIVPVR